MSVRRGVLALLVLPLALSTCQDQGPTGGGGRPGIADLHLRVLPPPVSGRFAPGLVVDRVDAHLLRPIFDTADTLASASAPLGINQTSVSLTLSALLVAPETLTVELEYFDPTGQLLFVASQSVLVGPGSISPPPLQPVYVGPGSNLVFLGIGPLDTILSVGDSLAFQATALDGQQQPVPSFYVSWSTNDPRVPINANGMITAPDLTKLVTVTAQAPNGVFTSTTLTLLGTAGLGLSPDSVEKLPGGTQQFNVVLGALRTSSFVWSVNGVDGGNASVGTVDTTGFFVAPAAVPAGGKVSVCARDTTRAGIQGCAVVVISTVPSAGADVIVFNDINFLADYDTLAGNTKLIQNLVSFRNTLPRSNGRQVVLEYSHASLCLQTAECDLTDLAEMNATINAQGLQVVVYDTISRLPPSLPPQVKALFIWTPQRAYDTVEINTLKSFAAEGGRIIFLGERLPYYGQFNIDSVENRFFLEMGAELTNVAADVAVAAPYLVPKAGIRTHQVTTGVSTLGFSAASVVVPGPNDFALVVDTAATASVLGAVAKIDLTPLPVSIPAPPSPLRAVRGAARSPWSPTQPASAPR